MMNEREFKLETSTHGKFGRDQDSMEINGKHGLLNTLYRDH